MKKIVFYHSAPEFLLCGQPWRAAVTCVGAADDEVALLLEVAGVQHRVALLKGREYIANDRAMAVYSATVAAELLQTAGTVRYCFECGGVRSDEYSVSLEPAGQLPPLVVTELYGRPKGKNLTIFIEVMNPTALPTDLYRYKLMFYHGKEPTAKDYVCALYLAETPGERLLAPGEVAALWPLMPQHHKAGERYLTREGFIETAMADFPKPAFDLATADFKLIPIEASRFDEVKGAYVPLEHINRLPAKNETTTLVIVPREAQPENGLEMSIFSMMYNPHDDGDRDTPVRHSSLWTLDVRHPERGISLRHKARMTPGLLDRGQARPVLDREHPAIVPLDADATIRGEGEATLLRFNVDGGEIADACIELKLADGAMRRYAAEAQGDGCWSVSLPERDIFKLKRLCYTINVYDGTRHTTIGTPAQPIVTRLKDLRGPYITRTVPSQGYGYDDTRTPTICVSFGDAWGVNLSASVLCVDKKNVTSLAKWEAGRVSYAPARPLRYGRHSYEIMLCDKLGNKTYRKLEFSICHPDELNLYHGEVHSHTAFSDGTATPLEAMQYAREVGRADFFAATEHSHYITDEVYRRSLEIADSCDEPGRFAALYGFEMTWNGKCALWGHMNVLGTDWMDGDIQGKGIPELYELLRHDRAAVAMFNHPGLAWGNFHDYEDYTADADRAVCLSEIKGAAYDTEYVNMLALGWHASPVFNEDNHSYDWTTATPSTTYVLAPALTRDNIMDAFRRRRTYSTGDSTMKIRFKVNGRWMGSHITNTNKLQFEADILTESDDGIGNIAIVGEDNIIVYQINVGALQSYRLRVTLPCEYDYYYLKLTSAGSYTVTAPVWIDKESPLKLHELEHRATGNSYLSHSLSTKLKNTSDSCLRDVRIDLYLTPASGFDVERTAPYRSLKLPILAAGATANVSFEVPDVVGMRRVTVLARGTLGRQRFVATSFKLLSPLAITAIAPACGETVDRAGVTVKSPFNYLQLYNMSGRDISLDDYAVRMWSTTGKPPFEVNILRFSGQVIKAGGALVVWVRPAGAALEVEDFDRHYGVMLCEGEDLMVTETAVLDASTNARRVDIVRGSELLVRCEYNFKQPPATDMHADRAITFSPEPTMTGKLKLLANDALPTPGLVKGDL